MLRRKDESIVWRVMKKTDRRRQRGEGEVNIFPKACNTACHMASNTTNYFTRKCISS